MKRSSACRVIVEVLVLGLLVVVYKIPYSSCMIYHVRTYSSPHYSHHSMYIRPVTICNGIQNMWYARIQHNGHSIEVDSVFCGMSTSMCTKELVSSTAVVHVTPLSPSCLHRYFHSVWWPQVRSYSDLSCMNLLITTLLVSQLYVYTTYHNLQRHTEHVIRAYTA